MDASSVPSLVQIRNHLATRLPAELVDRLFDAYREIKENFLLGRHEPSELNGGKLCEVVFRILQQETQGTYAKLGTRINNVPEQCRKLENATTANDTIRFHLPRLISSIYNIRNKRGVGHIGGDVTPNLADATLIATSSDWIIAELLRLHYSCSLDQAQSWADSLVQRKFPLVHPIGDVRRVLNPGLRNSEKVLLFLATEHPSGIADGVLCKWCEHSNPTVFKRSVLKPLHRKKLIEYAAGNCTALPPGLTVVERNYSRWAQFEPSL